MPGEEVSQAKQQLKVIIEAYLKDSDIQSVLAACDFADLAHSGITVKAVNLCSSSDCCQLHSGAYAFDADTLWQLYYTMSLKIPNLAKMKLVKFGLWLPNLLMV